MSFVQDLIAPGGRQMGDAAETASEAQKAISDKLVALQEQLMGFVQNADRSGMFDPERAAERFAADWDRRHGQDMEVTGAALRHAGLRPGDSELDYNLNKQKMRLDQDRYQGMEDARHKSLLERIQAYTSTAAPLSQAAATAATGGRFAMEGAQADMQGQQQTYSNLANLYRGISPFLRKQFRQGIGADSGMGPNPNDA